MKYSDLIVLSYRDTLNLVGDNGKIVPRDEHDISRVKYISQGFEINLDKKLYKTIFGADSRGNYIQNGFIIKDDWYQIGTMIIPDRGYDYSDGLLGVYDRTNFKHLCSMVWNAVEANTDYQIY